MEGCRSLQGTSLELVLQIVISFIDRTMVAHGLKKELLGHETFMQIVLASLGAISGITRIDPKVLHKWSPARHPLCQSIPFLSMYGPATPYHLASQ